MSSHGQFIQEIIRGFYDFFRLIIPEPQNRIPIALDVIPYSLSWFIPFFFLAYLARRPQTYLIRLLLLPIVITSTLASAFRYCWTIPALNVYNWGQGLAAEVVIAKALEYALTPEGMLRMGESQPNQPKGKAKAKHYSNGDTQNIDADSRLSSPEHQRSDFISAFGDALNLAHEMRGSGWKFGVGTHIPKLTRPLERKEFINVTLWSFIEHFLLLDFIESIIKLFPGVGTPAGGSIFYQNLPIPQRYIVSTTIHMLTGTALLSGFHMVYDLLTIIAVYVCDDSPSSWPPVMDHPWTADSMHVFWAKRWHQLLKRTFVVYGGIPGKWVAGNIGALLGTFIASGLFHECAIYAMGQGFDPVVPAFFALQGPILILERVWRIVTGKRVGGWIGRLWVYSMMFFFAQPMIDSWHRRGLGGGMVIPPFISPARVVLPLLVRVFDATVLAK
ncbi:uncharacterized protein C8R40DRAFT_1168138 [Lentinula edodes]|uniref:uncharacterized protein n=1 Tax=Lentinula edodes TaxID=5353 RepID=UPI001E8D3FD9|nr:uncharacterized protein C8R40DRAFT_1168138 [Lentinula edodes]KAH7878094.1 hypothetical protein C8R40DRAFT_1168138 [Lentinula edodes]